MANARGAKSERRARVLRRIRAAIASGLVSESPDRVAGPVLEAAIALIRTPVASDGEVKRAEAAIAALEHFGRPAPTYKQNAYARSWMRIFDSH
jgi:hypothetical protein